MEKRGRKRFWFGVFILFVIAGAMLIGYILGVNKGFVGQEILQKTAPPPKEQQPPRVETNRPQEKVTMEIKEANKENEESKSDESSDSCGEIEGQLRQFFRYLDKKNYVQHQEAHLDTYERFKSLIRKLSSQTPIPAGEGVDSTIMTRNIFYFSRMLDKSDLRLVKEILINEADTLEMNLDLLYRWLMLGNTCPDNEKLRPSFNVLYLYAGFFLNTIGGRSYLFRRTTELRLLVSYYCLLIIYQADQRGENTYGIDIFPELSKIAEEMSMYPDFQFQSAYAAKLTELQNYYLKRR